MRASLGRCECGNEAVDGGRCWRCALHVDCVAQEGVSVARGRFTGEPSLYCERCERSWVGFECVCDADYHHCVAVAS